MYTKRSIRKMFDVDMIEERQRAQQWLQGNSFLFLVQPQNHCTFVTFYTFMETPFCCL